MEVLLRALALGLVAGLLGCSGGPEQAPEPTVSTHTGRPGWHRDPAIPTATDETTTPTSDAVEASAEQPASAPEQDAGEEYQDRTGRPGWRSRSRLPGGG